MGLMTILCFRFETPTTWRAKSPYLHSPGTELPSYTLRHWVPFSLPLKTRRAAVEVFNPASTRASPSVRGIHFSTEHIKNTASNSSSIVACVFVTTEVFAEPFLNKDRLLWLWNSGSVRTCRNTVIKITEFNYIYALLFYGKHFLVDEFRSAGFSSVQEADDGFRALTWNWLHTVICFPFINFKITF
jgi:hypothetical protein